MSNLPVLISTLEPFFIIFSPPVPLRSGSKRVVWWSFASHPYETTTAFMKKQRRWESLMLAKRESQKAASSSRDTYLPNTLWEWVACLQITGLLHLCLREVTVQYNILHIMWTAAWHSTIKVRGSSPELHWYSKVYWVPRKPLTWVFGGSDACSLFYHIYPQFGLVSFCRVRSSICQLREHMAWLKLVGNMEKTVWRSRKYPLSQTNSFCLRKETYSTLMTAVCL